MAILTDFDPQPTMLSWFHRSTHVRRAWADDAAEGLTALPGAEPNVAVNPAATRKAQPTLLAKPRPCTKARVLPFTISQSSTALE
jgi:hypothetical protein